MNLLASSSNTKHIKHAIATAIVCSILLVLPGCGIPKLRNPFSGRELPETFNGTVSEENSSQVGIEEFFNDPNLITLFDEALVGNQDLKILNENIQIANNEILSRRGAYLPFISVGAGAGLDKYSSYTLLGADNNQNRLPDGRHFPTPLPDFMTAADLSWQIDIWRQLRNSRDAAAFRFLGTTDGRNYAVTRMVAEIAETYYRLMALDKRIENLDRIISIQEGSLERAKALKVGAQGTELGVQRFLAEVRKNQSEKLIINQEIIVTENRINFLLGRYPQHVERMSEGFYELSLHSLDLGVPAQLLQNRPDIRQAERELAAAGLDIKVARARFYPRLMISAEVGYDAFNPQYLFLSPESLIYSVAGNLVAPLINKKAIQADYMTANAMQLTACYHYQRVVLNAFTEVINRVTMVQNYTKSIEIKRQQLDALEASVDVAGKLFQNAKIQYMDVLFAQRDLLEARMVFIDTKREQLSAIVNTYQALGGGLVRTEPSEVVIVEPVESSDENVVTPPSPDQK